MFGFEHCQIQGDLQFKLCLNTSCVRPSCDAAAAVSTWCVCVCVQLVLKSWESWILDEMRLVWPLKQSHLLALKITSWTSSFQKCPCWQRDVNSTACSGCKLSSAFQGLCFSYNVGTVLFNERG